MSNFTTKLMDCLSENIGNELEVSLRECVRSMIEEAFNEMMKIELTSFLEYEPYERVESEDYRNGYSTKSFNTSFGTINLRIPRDRLNQFRSEITEKYSRHDETTEKTILKLFHSGLSNGEISEIVEALYSKKYSKTTVSNITKRVSDNVEAFKKRKLKSHYAVIYLDATYTAIRRDTVDKEGLCIALGITPEGYKEIIGYILAPSESSTIWQELLQDIRERGVTRVDLFVTDGLSGMPEAISFNYPDAKIQRCLVHVQRNIMSKVRVKDRKQICEDFKDIYQTRDKMTAQNKLENFKEKWGKNYKNIIESIKRSEPYLLTFYDFPESIRHSIYTTNIIEGLNKQVKRMTKHKEQFPDPDSLERFIVSLFNDYNMKFINRIHKGFADTGGFWSEESQ